VTGENRRRNMADELGNEKKSTEAFLVMEYVSGETPP
jgi:hypothetical protein